MVPPSQKYRQISFKLTGGSADPLTFAFAMRPEELTVEEPLRVNVTQTLGGAWLDEFGRGLRTINLSGHNGWRGGLLLSGEDMFLSLRDTVLTQWADRRKAMVDQHQDPDQIKLYFTDNLDSITAVVAPLRFSLRRSKSQPLLIMYQIQLSVLADANEGGGIYDAIINALNDPLRWIAGQLGLQNVIQALQSVQAAVQAAVAVVGAGLNLVTAVPAAVRQFIQVGVGLLNQVIGIGATFSGLFSGLNAGLLSSTIGYARGGSNAFAVLASDPTLPAGDRLALMTASAAFNDAACNMANSYNTQQYYADYGALLGASGCSSTAGGDSPSAYTVGGYNPFEDLFTASAPPVLLSADGLNAIADLQGDPMLMTGNPARLADLMQRAAAGISPGVSA